MQKKLLILAVVALVLIGGVVLVREKKVTTEIQQNETNQGASEDLLMSLNLDSSKNYRSEKYGFEVVIPKDWDSFRDVKIERKENGYIAINFFFETKDIRYFNDYNCQGKCVNMFAINIVDHNKFNDFFDERWHLANKIGKPGVIGVNNEFVFFDGGYSTDPPSDLDFLNNDRVKCYRNIIFKNP